RRYERRIAEDAALAQAYARAHAAYRAERLALLSPAELAWVRKKGYTGLLITGIAGIFNFRRVKCLHAQLAHFLAGQENPIGKQIAQELPGLSCPDSRCARTVSLTEKECR
ncbi:MAG: DUF501 domain-containing protein, partial [Candidatus Bipolaricaulota bacterium]|nr:DUF501 domain-containing protein [Candidatus Bipolaricaulota bacterium]MDW8127108.1 DUF501 domain-containing protein [Candidatus Bipolaricaulota bacterium]